MADSLLPELLEQLSKTQWTVRDIQHADNTPYADVCTIDCKFAMVVAATSGGWAAHTPSVRLAMRDVYTYAAVEATVVLPRHEPATPAPQQWRTGADGYALLLLPGADALRCQLQHVVTPAGVVVD